MAPGTLAKIADGGPARTRVAYVNRARLAAFGGPLPAAEIARLVLGAGAARLAAAPPEVRTATQIGTATVLDARIGRTVVGGGPGVRRLLADEHPGSSVITPETASAAQSCLGDAATETIVGPEVLGRKAAAGVGLQDDAGEPRLLLCFAPHFRRDLHAIERRLTEAFGDARSPSGTAPVIGEKDIGERDITRGIIPLDAVPRARLRELLAGGPALVELARG